MAEIPLSSEHPQLTLEPHDGASWNKDIRFMKICIKNLQNLNEGEFYSSNHMTLEGTGDTSLVFNMQVERKENEDIGLFAYMV